MELTMPRPLQVLLGTQTDKNELNRPHLIMTKY